ncbi:hypothetical protein, partial [Candidatus Poriferisodalis multihospitum]|uniref:hypothetical protein n=1 Tax=Candidatus Poriferisodalis multihospitum TaxID=2983191 RepID=UPI002B26403A
MGKTDRVNDRDRVRKQLRDWRDELIDLSRRNRLLYYRHLRSGSLGFEQDAADVSDRLLRGGRSNDWRV